MKITSIPQLFVLAIMVGSGAYLVFTPALVHHLRVPQATVAASPGEGGGNGPPVSSEGPDDPLAEAWMPKGHAVMIPGLTGTPGESAHSNSAVAAGLPPVGQIEYQAAVARLVSAASGRGADGSRARTAGTGNRFTQAEIDALKSGVTTVLTDLENAVVAEVFGEQLPLIGDGFQTAWVNNVAPFRHLTTMRTAILNALNTFTGSADYDPAAVATAIRNELPFFDGVTTVTAATPGDQARIQFVTRRGYAAGNVPIAADFGFPGLDFELIGSANVQTTASAQFDFAIGVDAEGFYLETAGSVFTFNTTTTGAGINTTARLAKLNHTVTNNPALNTAQSANFNILLKEPGGDGKLRVTELVATPDLLDATLTGNTRTALKLVSEMPNTALFPRVGTDLTLLWDFNSAVVDPDDDNSAFGSKPVLSLDNNRVLLDSFLNHFANGVLSKIRDVTQPVQPVIEVLSTPIPLLSDLGSEDVTIMDIFGLPQETQDAVNSLSRISDLADLAQGLSAGGMTVDLGDWSFVPDDPRVDGPEVLSGFPTRPPSSNKPVPLQSFLNEAEGIDGLDFPLLTDGEAVVDMLLGRNASLFTYRSEKITIEEEFRQYFPVLGPIGVTMGGMIGFSAQFGFGYDTQGMFDYRASGGGDLGLLANGFYAMSLDEQGNPLTGIELTAAVSAGVEFNLLIASAGVEGRIGATIGIYLDDQLGDEDGRIRADDFASHSIDDWFYASGRLWAGVSAYLEIGWPPFGISFEFDSPEVTLLSFGSRPDQTPYLAGWSQTNPTHLHLNVGDRAILRFHGDNVDTAESFLISSRLGLSGQELVVAAFDAENSFSTLPERIVGQAKLRGDTLEIDREIDIPVHFFGGPDRDNLRGGAADDLLEGDAGPDHLVGNGGDDTLRGGEDNDLLDGGDGSDHFDGGPGDDTAAWTGATLPMTLDLRTMTFGGAAIGDTLVSIERYRGTRLADIMNGSDGSDLLLHGDDGDDFIYGHDGADLLNGGKGNDTIEGGTGDDHIIGGFGMDTLDGGPGIDTLSFLDATFPVTASLLTGTGTRAEAIGDTYTGFEILVGSGLPIEPEIQGFPNGPEFSGDILHGNNAPNTIYGMDGADEIHGHSGNDILYGNHPDSPLSEKAAGFETDSIFGGDGDDIIHGHGDNDLLDGEAGADTILGGTGADHLRDLDPASPDHLDGEDGFDRLSADYSSSTAGLTFIVGQENGRVLPNGDQYHRMETLGEFITGSGNDIIRLATTPEPQRLDKTIQTGPGNDLVVADTRTSYAPGGRTHDSLHGGDGIDTLSFENAGAGITLNLSNNAVGGAAAEMTISGFEHLTGSGFDDTLTGSNSDNILIGSGGNDYLLDLDPASLDALDGGDGHDRLSADYSVRTESVHFTVGPENSMTFGNGESFQNMETLGQLFAGSGNDMIRLAASPEAERFNKTVDAGPGNDLVVADSRHVYGLAGRSNDSLHGGSGIDTLSFEQSIEGVIVDFGGLLSGIGYPPLGGAAAGLTISGFENLVGTNRVDILAGDNNNNVFTPLAGVHPPDLNFDQIHGGGGSDTLVVDYSQDVEAAVIGLRMTPNSGPYAWISLNVPVEYPPRRHYYTSIERFDLTGSQGADYLYGELISSGNDRFLGMGGHDVIYGRAGDDYLDGGEGGDYLDGEYGNETIYGGPGNDWLHMNGRASEAAGYGQDLADGGEGDDWISIHTNPGTGGNYARSDNRMQVDGGPGFDILTIDLAYLTTSFNWNDAAPTDHVLRNGGYIRNIERIRDICTGSGVDTILLRGRHDNLISTGDGNDVLNPGLGKDIVRMGYYLDDNLLIVDYSEGDTPDLGGAIQVYGSTPIERKRLSDNVVIDSITFAGGPSRMHFTGTSKRDVIWGFHEGNDILLGGAGNDQLDGNGGDDWIDGGPGADTMNDGTGNDTYIVDDPGDQVIAPGGEYWWVNGTDTVRSSIDFTLPLGIEILQLAGSAVSGTGNIIANSITGNTRNNILNGGGDNDSLNGGGGSREIDTLTGGTGADTFFLGLLGTRFYDDGNASSPGHDGFAVITDFTPSQSDRLRLAGGATGYLLGTSPVTEFPGSGLYHDSNGNATLDPDTDELIAILQSTETLTTANTINSASYQNAVDPAVVGLSAAPVPSLTFEGGAQRLAASFSILETLPANVRIEVQASNDLGLAEPWSMIARKSGNGAWTGPAQVITGPPTAGRVEVTVRDIPLFPQPPRRFLRIVLAPL